MSQATTQSNIMEFPEINRFKPGTAEIALSGYETISNPCVIRHKAKEKLEKFGLPTSRLERWKYTNIIPKLQNMNLNYEATDISFPSTEWVFDMLGVEPRDQDTYGDAMLVYANTAMLNDLNIIHLEKNTQETKHLKHDVSEAQCLHSRLLIKVEEGAELTLIEDCRGHGNYWHNQVTQFDIAKNGSVKHYKIYDHAPESVATNLCYANIARDGRYEAFKLIVGAGILRHHVDCVLREENSHCALNGINLLSGQSHVDTTLLVEHEAPHCRSDQSYKNIITDQAKGVFQGKIHVHQEAQDTDGYQLSNTLLLSDRAEMNTKPELEIYADDVRCSHGATTGQLDETPLFYLRQRGLSDAQARKLLIQAFMGEVIETISDDGFKSKIEEITQNWMDAHV